VAEGMCGACTALCEQVPVTNESDWRALGGRLRTAVADGLIELVESAPAATTIAEIRPPQLRQVWNCTTCAQLFILEIAGGHLLGDGWRPLHGN